MLLLFPFSNVLPVLTNAVKKKINKQYKIWKGRNKTVITEDDRIIYIEDKLTISFELVREFRVLDIG